MLWRDYHQKQSDTLDALYTRETIEEIRYLRWTRFVNDLRALAYEGLLEYDKHESGEMVKITLAIDQPETWDIC